jgi:hypothetical protein
MNNIEIICIPPHINSKAQPMDMDVKHLKKKKVFHKGFFGSKTHLFFKTLVRNRL